MSVALKPAQRGPPTEAVDRRRLGSRKHYCQTTDFRNCSPNSAKPASSPDALNETGAERGAATNTFPYGCVSDTGVAGTLAMAHAGTVKVPADALTVHRNRFEALWGVSKFPPPIRIVALDSPLAVQVTVSGWV